VLLETKPYISDNGAKNSFREKRQEQSEPEQHALHLTELQATEESAVSGIVLHCNILKDEEEKILIKSA
uniref:hypothetical protein n=1 Tax=Vibrio vulnificus TaxID=672 RepID=UPI0019D4C508